MKKTKKRIFTTLNLSMKSLDTILKEWAKEENNNLHITKMKNFNFCSSKDSIKQVKNSIADGKFFPNHVFDKGLLSELLWAHTALKWKNKITLKLYKHIKRHFSEEDTQTDTT